MTLCRAHSLYDGIIYVYNRALNDFLSPLEEMLDRLNEAVREHADLLTDEEVQLGNKVLLYVSCCLTGRAYPIGSLDEKQSKKVSLDIYGCLTSLKGKHGSYSKQNYPYLKLLLRFDAREFLNVLSMASQFSTFVFSDNEGSDRLQRIVDILMQIMLIDDMSLRTHLGAFLTFIARMTVQESGRVTITKDNFHMLLEAVLSAGHEQAGTSVFEERQQAVLQLLQMSTTGHIFDLELVLKWAELGKYFNVCEYLYRQKRDYVKELDCYLQDRFREAEVFDVINARLLNSADLNDSEKLMIKGRLKELIPVLSRVNAQKTAQIVINVLPDCLESLIACFGQDQAHHLCNLLSALFDEQRKNGRERLSESEALDMTLAERFVLLLTEQRAQSRLVAFLTDWDHLCTQNNAILKMCTEKRLVQAAVLLLEKRAQYRQAFDLLLQHMHTDDVDRFVCGGWKTLEFCKRYASAQDSSVETAQSFWMDLFSLVLLLPEHTIKTCADVKELLSKMVHSMIEFVAADRVLECLFNHPAFKDCTYSEHQNLIRSIFDGFEYEEILLSNAVSAVNRDAHRSLVSIETDLRRCPSLNATSQCIFCSRPIYVTSNQLILLFHCGHTAHVECCRQRQQSAVNWQCLCQLRNVDRRSFDANKHRQLLNKRFEAKCVTFEPVKSGHEYRQMLAELDDAPSCAFSVQSRSMLKSDTFALRLAPDNAFH